MLSFGLSSLFAQMVQVSGTVTSAEDGLPLPDVSVAVKGSTSGTVTNSDGKYTLNVTPNAVLVFSFVGAATKEISVEGRQVIDVALISIVELGEVVVTALGISREKKALGYSASAFSASDIERAKSVNPLTAIQGKVAGVDISSSPGPGTTQNVIIRGFSSFGNNQPLYIVDGVPVTNSQNRSGSDLNSQVDFGSGINALNPDNIENMTILKGAAATALYGSRAANGVVIITSKSGKNLGGKVEVAYDGAFTLTQVSRLPSEQSMFGQGWSGDRALDENGNWGAPFDGKDRVWGNVIDGDQLYKPYSYLKNRIRDFFDIGAGYKNAVSLSGGNEYTKYHLALSQHRVDGVMPTDADSYKRYTIATTGSHTHKKITVSSSVNFSSEVNKEVATGQEFSIYRNLNEIATDISIVDMKNYKDKFYNLDDYFTPYGLNPYFILNENAAVQNKYKIFGKFQVDYDILKNLKITYRFGGDFESSVSETHRTIVKFSEGSPNEGSSNEDVGYYQQISRQRMQMNHDAFIMFDDQFGDFSVNAILGINVNERSGKVLQGTINSIDIPGFYNLRNSLATAVAAQSSSLRRLYGGYVNAELGYKNYLFLTLTARNDWSSTLPESANSFFYPGSTLSFILSDYLKQKNINTGFVDFAKVRVAYGQTGNDADPYAIYDQYSSGSVANPGYPSVANLTFPLNGLNAYAISNTLGNGELKPELTKEFEIGAEVNFFKNRIGVDFSYYNRYTKGLIEYLPVDPSAGYSWRLANLGDVSNKGFELTLNLVPVKTKNFKWEISYNYSRNHNNVEKLDVDDVSLTGFGGLTIHAVEGKPLGQFKTNMAEKTLINGVEHTVVDGKGNPVATADLVFIGKDVNEKYRMGLTNQFSWKGLSLSGTFDFRYGGHLYSYTKDYMGWVGSGPYTAMNDRQPFLIPNSVVKNNDGTYSENTTPVDPTALHTFYSDGGLGRNDAFVIDRSYLKLRNVELSYRLPQSFCDKLRIKGVRISLNASNFLLWTPAENRYIDPETTTFGNDLNAKFGEFGVNPTYKTYSLGLNFTF
jgi:TonB-linked SusC/RagA family outer membrane protein